MEFSRPEGALSADTTLWLYTSLSSGSSTIVTATSRLETILKANRVPFKALDVATEEKARMLWGRRAGKRKLPGLVKQGMVLADLEEIEEWNEYGEVRENLLDEDESTASPALASLSKPATPAAPIASTPPPRPDAPTPVSAATHNVGAGPTTTPSAAAIRAAGSISSLKSTNSTVSAGSGKSQEGERKEQMLSLAEQVAARAKKSSGLRTSSGQVLSRNKADSSASKATVSTEAESEKKPEDKAEKKTETAAETPELAKANEFSPDVTKDDKPVAEKNTVNAAAEPSTARVVPVKEEATASSSAQAEGESKPAKDIDDEVKSASVDDKNAQKTEATVAAVEPKPKDTPSKVVSTDAAEKAPTNEMAASKAAEKKAEDADEDEDEEDDGSEEDITRKTQEQDPISVENGMVELEIAMLLNSPTMGSVRERRKRSDGGKRGVPGSPDTLNSTLEEDEELPGFHSPTIRSSPNGSPLSSMSPMSGFGFINVDNIPRDQPNNADKSDGHSTEGLAKPDQESKSEQPQPRLDQPTEANDPEGKTIQPQRESQQTVDNRSSTQPPGQRSMVTSESYSNEKPVVRVPSLPDDEEEVSAGCCGGLFGGGKKKKKKQKTS